MTVAALVVAACLVGVVVVLPPALAAASWPVRAPGTALVLWQATGLAGGLLLLMLCATVALAPLGPTHLAAVQDLPDAGPQTWLVGAVGLGVLLRLLGVLLVSAWRTVRARRRNRVLVDLLAGRNLLLQGASVVDHDVPVAYCLPGLRPRLVLSRGALDLLTYEEVAAVLAHERAHLAQRHDLVVLPFVALGATFPALPAVRTAQSQVGLLVELLADDGAARRHDRKDLARALWKIGSGQAPVGALGSGGSDLLLRAQRLLEPPPPLPTRLRVAVAALALCVLASPLLGIGLPYLV